MSTSSAVATPGIHDAARNDTFASKLTPTRVLRWPGVERHAQDLWCIRLPRASASCAGPVGVSLLANALGQGNGWHRQAAFASKLTPTRVLRWPGVERHAQDLWCIRLPRASASCAGAVGVSLLTNALGQGNGWHRQAAFASKLTPTRVLRWPGVQRHAQGLRCIRLPRASASRAGPVGVSPVI
jgi:hypothetical protein